MRRLLIATALTLVALAALAGPAAAKDMSVSLAGGGPPSLDPGEPWNAQLLVHGEPDMLAAATPGISIRNRDSGETQTFDARRTGRRAPDGQLIYRARVVFPSEGAWTYTLIDGVTDRAYEGGFVRVGDAPAEAAPEASRPSPAAAPANDDSFPVWPVLAGVGVFLLAAAAALVVVRQRRPQPTA